MNDEDDNRGNHWWMMDEHDGKLWIYAGLILVPILFFVFCAISVMVR